MSSEQSNILKRHDQINKWHESETDKASSVIKEADKIKFTKEVQFLSACNNNDWEEIERLLNEGIDINSSQDDGLTSLHQACIDDDERLVKYLIEHGADIDVQDKEGWTPLFAAISCNYLPITKYLVSCGARLDMVSFDGELPLDQSNNDTIASYIKDEMIKRQLDPDEIRNRERNFMLVDVEAMKVTKDFSPYTLVDSGGSLLHIAACKDYMDVLEKLVDIISPDMLNYTDNDGWNALHVAAHWGNRKACVMLINADIDFDRLTFSNQTVLEVSDDDVKPYIREEIRKARFRRQERPPIKRPAETPNPEYQPSDTKIICQNKKPSPPVANQPAPSQLPHQQHQQQPHQASNGDTHPAPIEDSGNQSRSDVQEMISTPSGILEPVRSTDGDLKANANDVSRNETEPICDTASANSNISSPEAASTPSIENNQPARKRGDSLTGGDNKNTKPLVPVMTPSKTAESESQRKDKARHVRSTRRSTQGVTAEDIEEAKRIVTVDKNNLPDPASMVPASGIPEVDGTSSRLNCQVKETDTETKSKSRPEENGSQLSVDKTVNGDNDQVINPPSLNPSISVSTGESLDQAKGKTGGHVVNKRRTRERPPTGIVDPKDIQAALLINEPSRSPEVSTQKEPEIDYRVLYENELKEKEKLQRNLLRLRRDLDQSEDTIKSLQNNHVVSKVQTSSIMAADFDLKEMEKLRDDNKKMKEANSALIRVISRLSHPASKSVTTPN